MSPDAGSIVVFADLDADLWGVACGGPEPQATIATLTSAEVVMEAAGVEADGSGWTVSAPGLALRLERMDAPTATADAARHLAACRVVGAATIDGVEREFEVGGIRIDPSGAPGAATLRLFASWFAGGVELSLLAARAARAANHDKDSVSVIAIGEEHPEVIDPRLSTTYDAHGAPRRVGAELWLADEADSEQQWPRHAAGAVTGSAVTGKGVLSSLRAHALTCASRHQQGAGVYLLLARD